MTKTSTVLRAAAQRTAALRWRIRLAIGRAGASAATPAARRRISRRERSARAAIGMPPGHPELLTRKPGRAEWRHLAAWITELWPRDEYTAIVTDALRRDPPSSDWR
ncbi:MAG: hypothetical protein ACYCO9_21800 [Streptosporangiaceae bacterium]